MTPRRYLAELRTTDADSYELGQEITAEVFEAGTVVDATGTSKGKGTAGVMKRHGFKGLGASPRHAAQAPLARLDRWLRHPGSRVQGPAHGGPHGPRPGHHPEPHRPPAWTPRTGLILVKGAVPGPKGGVVFLKTAAKGDAQ